MDDIRDVVLHPGEEFFLIADYTDVLASGETVTAGAASVYNADGTTGPSGLFSGAVVVESPVLKQKITAGIGVTVGARYIVVLTATTSTNLDYVRRFRVAVVALPEIAVGLVDHALTTLPNLKRLLAGKDELPPVEHDDMLTHWINAITDAVEQYCGRRFRQTTYTDEVYERRHGPELPLRQYPIVSVSAVSIGGAAIAAGSRDDQYSVRAEEGILWRRLGWGDYWRIAPPQRDVLVTYTAGYILPKDEAPGTPRTLPHDLEDAVAELVLARYKRRGQVGLAAESTPDGVSQTFAWWPAHVRAVLDRYRRPRW